MHTVEHAEIDKSKEVDCLIKRHIVEQAENEEQGLPVAAISASDRFSWAKQLGVDVDYIDTRLNTICREVTDVDRHWAVPRYRMK